MNMAESDSIFFKSQAPKIYHIMKYPNAKPFPIKERSRSYPNVDFWTFMSG